MTNHQMPLQIVYMIALQSIIANIFAKKLDDVEGDQKVSGLIEKIVRSAKEQKSALTSRLGMVGGSERCTKDTHFQWPLECVSHFHISDHNAALNS